MQYSIIENTKGLFPTRIGRTSFLLRGALFLFAGFLAGLLISGATHAGFVAKVFCIGGGAFALLFIFAAMFRSLLMPRLRDIGLHPAWSLLILVHALSGLFLLALLLIPSNAFARRQYIV